MDKQENPEKPQTKPRRGFMASILAKRRLVLGSVLLTLLLYAVLRILFFGAILAISVWIFVGLRDLMRTLTNTY